MILAWWDVDVAIGAFHRRKVTARPLRDLENVLGHRLHVEGWRHNEFLADGVWKFDAYNYLNTNDPALAVYATLLQLSRVSSKVAVGLPGFNRSAVDADDIDEATICTFYWGAPDQIGLPRYVSSGVLLAYGGHEAGWGSRQQRASRRARPVVRVPNPATATSDYLAEFTVRIVCGNKKDVVDYHWPRYQAAHFPNGIDEAHIDNRTHAGKPNIIRVRQTLRGLHEHEAVAHCLANAVNLKVQLKSEPSFRFSGELPANHTYRDGISAFNLTRLST